MTIHEMNNLDWLFLNHFLLLLHKLNKHVNIYEVFLLQVHLDLDNQLIIFCHLLLMYLMLVNHFYNITIVNVDSLIYHQMNSDHYFINSYQNDMIIVHFVISYNCYYDIVIIIN